MIAFPNHGLQICCGWARVYGICFSQANDLDNAFSELQRAWRAGDRAAAVKLFSDDISFITRSGIALNKQELVSSLKPGSGGGTMEKIAEKKAKTYGDFAIISFKDGEGNSAARRTIVWQKTQEGWKVLSMQTTPIRP